MSNGEVNGDVTYAIRYRAITASGGEVSLWLGYFDCITFAVTGFEESRLRHLFAERWHASAVSRFLRVKKNLSGVRLVKVTRKVVKS